MKKKLLKITAIVMALNFLTTALAPTLSYALTAGPTAPEYTSFEPIDTTDMVNLATGDFTYNIPLLEVPGPEGGYPLALSYHAGISPEEEASWVGLGWSLNAGAINRFVNLNPDDVKSDIERVHDYWQGGITEYSSVGVGMPGFSVNIGQSVDTYLGTNNTVTIGVGIYNVNAYANISSSKYGESGIGVSFDPLNSILSEQKGFTLDNFQTDLGLYYSVSRNKLSASIGIGGGIFGGASLSTDKNMSGYSVLGYAHSNQSSTSSSNLTVESKHKSFSLFGVLTFGGGYTRYYLDQVDNNKLYGSLYNSSIPSSNFTGIIADNYTLKSATTNTPATYDGDKEMSGSIPAYDFYSVTGQGVSGTIQPHIFEYGSFIRNVDPNKSISFDNSFNSFEKEVGFRFVGDFSNSITRNVDITNLNLSSYFEITAEIGKEKKDYISSSFIDFDKQKSVLASSNHVEWFTNAQIVAAAMPGGNLSSLHGFIPDLTNRPLSFSTLGYSMSLSDNIGGFLVTNETGMSYHYSLPVYNFEDYNRTEDPAFGSYREISKTMPYAYSWLITGITGPDYVDRTPLGVIDDNDWGYWVKFDYGKWTDQYKWRTPSEAMDKDIDSGIKKISYGKKQLYYLDAIRTRSHTALFVKSLRTDAKSVSNLYNGGYSITRDGNNEIQDYSVSCLRLDKILMFSNDNLDKALLSRFTNVASYSELKSNGTNLDHSFMKAGQEVKFHNGDNIIDAGDFQQNLRATVGGNFDDLALKQFEFNYTKALSGNQTTDYFLCDGTPNSFDINYTNFNKGTLNFGKLTLQSIIVKGANGSNLIPPTRFSYNKNPNYTAKAIDVWGNYKSDFSLTYFDKTQQNTTVSSAANVDAWSLSEIQFPIGSKMKIEYESDSYNNVIVSPYKNFAIKNFEIAASNQIKINFYNTESITNINNIPELQVNEKIDLKLFLAGNSPGADPYNFTDLQALNINSNGTNADGTSYLVVASSTLFNRVISYSLRSGNIIVDKKNNTEVLGGGLRVKSFSTEANGIEYITDYKYFDGTTSFAPIDFLSYSPVNNNPFNNISEYDDYRNSVYKKFLPIIADNPFLPPPGVLYSNVIVQTRVKNNVAAVNYDGEGSVKYEFETFNNSMLPRVESPNINLSDGTTLKYIKFKNLNSRLGTLKRMTVYKGLNATGNILSYVENKTIYDDAVNYEQGIRDRYQDQGRTDQVFMEKRTVNGQKQLMITELEYYPNISTRTVSRDSKKGMESETKILGYDFYTGIPSLSWMKDSYQNEFLTKNVMAHEVYPKMSYKILDPTNKHMLANTVATYQYKVVSNNTNSFLESGYNKIGLVSANANTWNNSLNIQLPDGTLSSQVGIWRQDASYIWIGNDAKSLDESGVFNLVANSSDFIEFDFSNLTLNETKNWQKNSSITVYDVFSLPLENVDFNNNYNGKLLDPSLKVISASCSNASIGEFAYSGSEYKDNYSPVSIIKEGNVSNGTGTIIQDRAHSGKYSLQVNNASDGYKFSFTPKKGRKYRASAWIYLSGNTSTNLDNVRLVARAKNSLGNFVDVGFSGRKTTMFARGFYLLTLDITPVLNVTMAPVEMEIVCRNENAGLPVYFDDFSVHPFDANMVSYIYDQESSKIIYMIDNDNIYTKFEYDDHGRLIKTFKERIGKDIEILMNERRYNHGNK